MTYRLTVDRDAAELEQPLTNLVDIYVTAGDTWVTATSDVYVGSPVEGATSPPTRPAAPTAPPTDTADQVIAVVPGSGVQLILVLFAGITLVAALLLPAPRSVRRRRDG